MTQADSARRFYDRISGVDCQPIDARSFLERSGFEIVASEDVAIWGLPVRALVGRPSTP